MAKDRALGGQIKHTNPTLKVKTRLLSGPTAELAERDSNGKIVETAGIMPLIGGALFGPVGGALGSVVENPDQPAQAAVGGLAGGALGGAAGQAAVPMAESAVQGAGSAISNTLAPAAQGAVKGLEDWGSSLSGAASPAAGAAAAPAVNAAAPAGASSVLGGTVDAGISGSALGPFKSAYDFGTAAIKGASSADKALGLTPTATSTTGASVSQTPAPTQTRVPMSYTDPAQQAANQALPEAAAPIKPLSQAIGEGFKGAGEFVSKWGTKIADAVVPAAGAGIGAAAGGQALADQGKKQGSSAMTGQDILESCDKDILDQFLENH